VDAFDGANLAEAVRVRVRARARARARARTRVRVLSTAPTSPTRRAPPWP